MYTGLSGIVVFGEEAAVKVLRLCRAQCSASRTAFRLIQKKPLLKDNEIIQAIKSKYPQLNGRNLIAAVRQARISDPSTKVIFGGKKLWSKLKVGEISKEE